MAEQTSEEIALERINEAIKTGATKLYLAGLGISTLPAEIGQATNLVSLDISWNGLTVLPEEIGLLTNLTSLSVASNQLTTLPSEIWQLTKLVSLDLFGNQLTTIPAKIENLSILKSLSISKNQITYLPAEIGKLANLTSLSIASNRLSILPVQIWQLTKLNLLDLSTNQLTAISSKIGQLTHLTSLNLANNQITQLPKEIWSLVNLTSLELKGNDLTSLPSEIGNLINLKILNLSRNGFSNLPNEIGQLKQLKELIVEDVWVDASLTSFYIPETIGQLVNLISLSFSYTQLVNLTTQICDLTNLRSLDLSNTELTTLPIEIGRLTNLTSLDLSSNALTALPSELKQLKSLQQLNLQENEILSIPPEILNNNLDPQVIFGYYFASSQKSLNEVKVILVGQGSVGKTSLIRRLIGNSFDVSEIKTEGISIKHLQVNPQSQIENRKSIIRLNIWDFGGQEIMHATHQFFLTKRSLYLLVLDSRLTQEENRVEYWLKIIQSFGGESPVLIVGNKIDQHPLDIDRTGLQKKYPNIVGILETSAATGAGIEALKATVAEQVNSLPHVRDLLPETWFTVKTKLEELGRRSNYITHDKYLDLCADNKVSDGTSQRTLIGFLHDLGVVLHFPDDPRLEALGILNPQWVTNGVYKILNSHTLFQNKGVLTVAMLDEILNLPEYPRGKRLFIVDMMKKFELCYDIEADKTFLVPDLLPKDEPAKLKFNGIPAFEYAYPVLPSSVITRFIVRMNQHIYDGLVWRTGTLLKMGDNTALVKADIEDRKITIAIDGLEHTRRETLTAIFYHLDEIHASIKGLDPERLVPVPGAKNAKPIPYNYLLMLEAKGIETLPVPDGNRLIDVNVRKVLSGVPNEVKLKESAGNVTNNIIIGGNFDGNLTIGDGNQSIKDSYNKITSAKIDSELKQALGQLAEAVSAMAKSLPEEQVAEVTEDLSKLVDEATKSKPNKRWYSVSIDGLIKAAENVEKVGEPVINLSRKVLSLLAGGMVK